MTPGPLILVSGPSGCGKSTVIDRVLATSAWPVHLSVSVTTRARRPGETEDVDYHYWTKERFLQKVQENAFLEWADVFGNCYGTLKEEVEPYRARGIGVLLEIDVAGWKQVKRQCPELVSIFIRTSSPAALEERLRQRRTESEESIQRRLRGAQVELAEAHHYDYQVINDDLEAAVAEVRAIVAPLIVAPLQERPTHDG